MALLGPDVFIPGSFYGLHSCINILLGDIDTVLIKLECFHH